MQVVIDSLITNYVRSGKGKTILLLHGWGDSSIGFRELKAALEQHYDVIALDLPGFGKTQAPISAWGLDDYAQFVQAFVDKTDTNPYAIIGHSNGGAIAVRGLGGGVLRAERLVLIDSAGIRGEYKGRVTALRAVTKTGKVLVAPLPEKIKDKLRRKVYKTVGSDMLVAEHMQETFKKVVNDDVRPDASNITIPTILIYGENDTQTPAHYGEILSELIPHSELVVVKDAGHFVHQDQLQVVTDKIQEFLA